MLRIKLFNISSKTVRGICYYSHNYADYRANHDMKNIKYHNIVVNKCDDIEVAEKIKDICVNDVNIKDTRGEQCIIVNKLNHIGRGEE